MGRRIREHRQRHAARRADDGIHRNLFTLLNPLTLLGGLTTLGLFLTHGALFAALRATRAGRDGWGFTGTFVCIALVVATLFTALFPDVLPNSNPGQFGLSVTNASSSECTLRIMTGAAVVFMPIVLAYQAWSYWVFRRRLTKEHIPAAAHY
ncbi:MAG: cytochrome d ubiquinol oxidase subunit II [Dermatophilaceae bacterium]